MRSFPFFKSGLYGDCVKYSEVYTLATNPDLLQPVGQTRPALMVLVRSLRLGYWASGQGDLPPSGTGLLRPGSSPLTSWRLLAQTTATLPAWDSGCSVPG